MAPYNMVGVNVPHVGYGRMVDEFLSVLTDRVEITDDAETVVYGMIPDMVKGWWHGQRVACMTMWETDRLPHRFHRLCPMFDTILVPCKHNQELFGTLHDDVRVVPLGVNHNIWWPQQVDRSVKFRFMTGGSGWLRKGIDSVIQAFTDANLPDAELVIKCPPYIIDEPTKFVFPDNVIFVREALTREQERDLHATADCFISGSRGEGYGLIPLQQAALGNLLIAPIHTGHAMFRDVIDYPLDSAPAKAFGKDYDQIGNWQIPDHDQMVDAIRDAYKRGRLTHRQRLTRANRTLKYSWEAATDTLLTQFPPAGRLTQKVWVRSGAHRRLVRALTKVIADVGEYKIRMEAGETQAVPVSTITHLLECGLVEEIQDARKV